MTDQPELLEFTLDNNMPENHEAEVKSEQKQIIEPEIATHVDKIINAAVSDNLAPIALAFINEFWKRAMTLVASRHGVDSVNWRACVKKLNNLCLFLEPEVRKQNHQVMAKLLPSLLGEMKQDLMDLGINHSSLDKILKGLSQNHLEQTRDSLPTQKPKEIIIDSEDKSEKVDAIVEFQLPDDVSKEESLATEKIDIEQISEASSTAELSPFDLESIDIDNDVIAFELPEESIDDEVQSIEDPLTKITTSSEAVSALDLPPLELDIEPINNKP